MIIYKEHQKELEKLLAEQMLEPVAQTSDELITIEDGFSSLIAESLKPQPWMVDNDVTFLSDTQIEVTLSKSVPRTLEEIEERKKKDEFEMWSMIDGEFVEVKQVTEKRTFTLPSEVLMSWMVTASETKEEEETFHKMFKNFMKDKTLFLGRFIPKYKIVDDDEVWDIKDTDVVLLSLEENGGTLLVMTTKEICHACGRLTLMRRMSYVWKGSTDPEFLELGYGASVKHYYSECSFCGVEMSG